MPIRLNLVRRVGALLVWWGDCVSVRLNSAGWLILACQ